LNFQNKKHEELENLVHKAKEFEKIIKDKPWLSDQNMCRTTANSQGCQTLEVPGITVESKKNLRTQESKIREELAHIFAYEISKIQQIFYDELETTKLSVIKKSNELQEKSSKINVQNEQLELLKFTILEERNEFFKQMKKLNSLNRMKEEEFEEFVCKIEDFLTKLPIEEQREEKIIEIEDSNINTRLEVKITLMLNKMKDLSKKYHSAKSTAFNYKKYSEEKEKHFRDQYEHVKSIYIAELRKKDKINQEMIKNIKKEYQNEIDLLKKMLSN
jgi:hypothetical protein